MQDPEELSATPARRLAWNKGKLIGAKPPLRAARAGHPLLSSPFESAAHPISVIGATTPTLRATSRLCTATQRHYRTCGQK